MLRMVLLKDSILLHEIMSDISWTFTGISFTFIYPRHVSPLVGILQLVGDHLEAHDLLIHLRAVVRLSGIQCRASFIPARREILRFHGTEMLCLLPLREKLCWSTEYIMLTPTFSGVGKYSSMAMPHALT